MIKVSRNSKISLPTTTLEDKYFYLTNSDYNSFTNYIYIFFQALSFYLRTNSIKFCLTNISPSSSPDSAVNGCSYTALSYYNAKTSSGDDKYYYKISTNSSYHYTIVQYDGHPPGKLYVICDDIDLAVVKMTQVYRHFREHLPTTISQDKYFYLTNNEYYPYSSYIYICLEDNSFDLSYNSIKYCQTSINPSSNPDSAINDDYWSKINYYKNKSSSGTTRYYYKFFVSSSEAYSIVYYDGKNSSGSLYVTSHYDDLSQSVKMTHVSRSSKTSLPTTSSINKYFYVNNSDYYSYSSYIYFYLEDNSFNLYNNDIKYCHTNNNPYNNPDDAVKDCSFNTISYYGSKELSGSKIYHYKFEINSSYSYSIVYYEGRNPSGSLYAYCNYESTSEEDKDKVLSTGAIVGIVIGSIAFLVVCIIIMYYFCPCCRRNKNDLISETQPNYFAPIYSSYPSNQTNDVLPTNNPNIPLQTVSMPN